LNGSSEFVVETVVQASRAMLSTQLIQEHAVIKCRLDVNPAVQFNIIAIHEYLRQIASHPNPLDSVRGHV
jgi:hypothetical protein